jgi:hypothetical protein
MQESKSGAAASRVQINRSRAAWTACEGIRAAEQIGGSVRARRGQAAPGWGDSLKVLAGRRCRRVLAGEDVEGVPVLRAAEGVSVSFGLLEAEDVQAA